MATKKDTDLRIISNDLSYIRDDVKEIKANLSSGYVTKDQFEPVKKIVYGLVGLILVAVVGALMGLIVIQ
jgi:hypothetical protein